MFKPSGALVANRRINASSCRRRVLMLRDALINAQTLTSLSLCPASLKCFETDVSCLFSLVLLISAMCAVILDANVLLVWPIYGILHLAQIRM